jgi:hypothetical protein
MAITKEGRDAERREKARLRSERARRARGIMPREKAKTPWLAEGISRRRKRAREQAVMALAAASRQAMLDRLDVQAALLRSEIDRAARFAGEAAVVIAELAAIWRIDIRLAT